MGKVLAAIIGAALIVIFLYQNSGEVPVKFFVGEPRPISLVYVVLVSVVVGFGVSTYLYLRLRRRSSTRGKGLDENEKSP